MKSAASLLALVSVLLVVSCGSTTGDTATLSTYSAREVERAFFQAGVPFQQELRRVKNPYLHSANETFGSLEAIVPKAEREHLQTVLVASDRNTFAMRMAYVFDSVASAAAAVRSRPLSKWMESNHPVIHVRKLNVVIVAANSGDSATTRRVRRAIAALQ